MEGDLCVHLWLYIKINESTFFFFWKKGESFCLLLLYHCVQLNILGSITSVVCCCVKIGRPISYSHRMTNLTCTIEAFSSWCFHKNVLTTSWLACQGMIKGWTPLCVMLAPWCFISYKVTCVLLSIHWVIRDEAHCWLSRMALRFLPLV